SLCIHAGSVLWVENMKPHALIGGNSLDAQPSLQTILPRRNHRCLRDVLIAYVFAFIKPDAQRGGPGVRHFRVPDDLYSGDLLYGPIQDASGWIRFKAAIKNVIRLPIAGAPRSEVTRPDRGSVRRQAVVEQSGNIVRGDGVVREGT